MTELTVKSHVARDLLQSSEVFKTDKKVVWEYVANGLQYTDPGRSPKVLVQISETAKTIRVSDNGRGMRFADLQHFFTMHGENLERRAGRIGRGLFGTGKSAAFGIGGKLRVTSIRDGARSSVELSRRDIEKVQDGSPVPIRVLERDVPCSETNGTIIEVGGIQLRKLDRAGIVAFIERHLARYPRDVEVFVDHHECRFQEPEEAERFEFNPAPALRASIGDVVLLVKVSRGPLDREQRGIQVFSYQNWHTTTLAGLDDKRMAEYIFGEVEVPALEDYKGLVRPFDNTRSGELNPENPVVQALMGFIGSSIEKVRLALVEREKFAQREEEAKRLAKEAKKIGEVLSRDFAEVTARLQRALAVAGGRQPGGISGEELEGFVAGGEVVAELEVLPEAPREGVQGDQGGNASGVPAPPANPSEDGGDGARPVGGTGNRRSSRGGLTVEYKHAGASEHRGVYVGDRRTIVINLDHPQVFAALSKGGVDDPTFLRLTWEVASAEYAVALAQELVEPYTSPDEAMFEVRETIDRISRRLATLYQ